MDKNYNFYNFVVTTTADLEASLPQQIETPTIVCLVVLNGIKKCELRLNTVRTAGEVKTILQHRHPDIEHVKIALSVSPFTRLDEQEPLSFGGIYDCECRRKTGDLTIFVVGHLKS
jgi:hypothetical protein